MGALVERVGVGVDRDDVQPGRPVEDVHGLETEQEVRGDRDLGRDPAQDGGLGLEAGAQRLVAEAQVVELLGGVGVGGGDAGRADVVEGGVALRPEVGGPGVVERVDVVRVPLAQPAPEVGGGGVAVAGGDVAAVLVADVPQPERRMAAVVGGEPFDQGRGAVPIDRAGRAEVLAAAWTEHGAVGGDRQDLGMLVGEPRRR
nr:hypothetical protein [Nonomuraea indica]